MTRLRVVGSVEEFAGHPVGAGVLVETSFVWCASPTLGGSTCWGAPNAEQTRRVMRALATIMHPDLGPGMDVILDGYRIDTVDPGAVLVMFEWTRQHLGELTRKIKRQVGVPPPSLGALILAGMLPVLGESYPHRIVTTPLEAFRHMLGAGGDALCDEVMGHVATASQTSALTGALRALLRTRSGNLTLEEASRLLHISSRTLQRELIAVATSFRAEQLQSRLVAAQELLYTSDEKLAVIAGRLGLSEQGLNRLVRDRMQTTPELWRRQLRNR